MTDRRCKCKVEYCTGSHELKTKFVECKFCAQKRAQMLDAVRQEIEDGKLQIIEFED